MIMFNPTGTFEVIINNVSKFKHDNIEKKNVD